MRQRLASQPELFDFGPEVPFTVTPAAKRYLRRMPSAGWHETVDTVEHWAEKAGVKKAALSVYVDPEYPRWRYLYLNLLVSKSRKSSFELSDDLYQVLEEATAELEPGAVSKLFEQISINPVPIREWRDEPAFTI